MGYADDPYNTTTHLLWYMGATIAPDADPRYTWTPTSLGWWSGVLKGEVSGGGGANPPVTSGVNPVETGYSLYGHPVPISLGRRRIGGEIISGPWLNNGLASFCISFGFPFDVAGSCDIREIAFDSEVVWDTGGASGVTTSAGGTFKVEAFTFRFYPGTLTQAVDPLETTYFGADAVAYRPQILLWFENLPIANTKFKKIPYVAALIGDAGGDDINLGESLDLIAYSPWVGLTSSQFETVGVTDGLVNGGVIIAQDTEFLGLIQKMGTYYGSWDILQTDKLRVVDRGNILTADIAFDTSALMNRVAVVRQGPDTVPKDLELSTIDPDSDFTIIPALAKRPRDPVPVTTSVGKSADYLPLVMDADTRQALVTLAKYRQEAGRKTITGTAMAYGYQIEPGTLILAKDLNEDFNNETFKVVETLHGVNYSVEFTAQSLLKCSFVANSIGCTPAADFLARTSGLDALHSAAYIELICGLIEDGVWDNLDLLRIYATQNSSTALLNLCSSNYTGVIHGSPTFTADRGFTGIEASSTDYIDSGFNPSTASPREYSQQNAHISGWYLLTSAFEPPNGSSNGSVDTYAWPRYSGDNKAYCRINSTNAGNPGTPAAYDGHFMGNRQTGLINEYYRNGTNFLSALTTSQPVANLKFYELGFNNNGTPKGSGNQQAMFSVGAGLTPTQATNFYTRLRTYMTAVGVP